MKRLLPLSTLGVAGLVGVGLLSAPVTTTAAGVGDDAFAKRDEDAVELVLVDDDDDDDTADRSGGTRTRSRSRETRASINSRVSRDGTRSNFTKVSRDRDRSRGDKTRDWTRDGGDRTRDWTANKTNDRSRHDTRGGRR